jgi:Family of unknown function (DUF6412)
MLFWAVVAAVSHPALDPSQLLVGGLAVVVAALLIVAATARLPLSTAPGPMAWQVAARLVAAWPPSRTADPDAAGRPRPRAPSAYPTAA